MQSAHHLLNSIEATLYKNPCSPNPIHNVLFLANMNKRIILIQALVLAVFWILYLSLEHQTFYEKTLGQYSDNWQNVNGERSLGNVPYVQPENNRMVQWDARHYELIKDHGYDTEKAGGDFIYAFFPLFPLIWKASLLPPMGVLFLNYLFFSISIFLLLTLFSSEKNVTRDALLSSALPGLIIFLIPYTEATYMLMVSIGIWGFVKKKYWIYFVGLFLAALARPSFTFLLLIARIGVEFMLLLQHKNVRTFAKHCIPSSASIDLRHSARFGDSIRTRQQNSIQICSGTEILGQCFWHTTQHQGLVTRRLWYQPRNCDCVVYSSADATASVSAYTTQKVSSIGENG
jgi:hypothetical protein